ncbi:MAG: prealbumin-like fold domain-containing protein [Christensenellales bacterium]
MKKSKLSIWLMIIMLLAVSVVGSAVEDEAMEPSPPECSGVVIVVLRDGVTGKPISDQSFELFTDDGQRMATLTTKENGCLSANLLEGEYYVKQSTFPDGYEQSDTKYSFQIEHQDCVTVVNASNNPLTMKELDTQEDIDPVLAEPQEDTTTWEDIDPTDVVPQDDIELMNQTTKEPYLTNYDNNEPSPGMYIVENTVSPYIGDVSPEPKQDISFINVFANITRYPVE